MPHFGREYGPLVLPSIASSTVFYLVGEAYVDQPEAYFWRARSGTEGYLGREYILTLARLRGDQRARIDFRHIIGQLPRKPGAFVNYKHREQLYPILAFKYGL